MAGTRKIKTIARMSIQGPGTMTAQSRRDVAQWLRSRASHLLKQGGKYTTGRFTAAFNYTK